MNDEPIVISDDEDTYPLKPSTRLDHEDEQLRRAIELSKLDASNAQSKASSSASDGDSEATPGNDAGTSAAAPTQFLSQRAQLEKERLERQKRMRAQGTLPPEDAEPPAKRANTGTDSSAASSNAKGKGREPGKIEVAKSANTSTYARETLFWDGELRQTANMHVKDTKPVFRLSEVLGKVSSFSKHFCFLSHLGDINSVRRSLLCYHVCVLHRSRLALFPHSA